MARSRPERRRSGSALDLMDHISNSELAGELRTRSTDVDVDEVTAHRLRKRLNNHIGTAHRQVRRRRAWALGAAAVVVTAVSVGFWIGGATNPAQALLDIAQVTEALPSNEFAGAIVERSEDQLVLQIESTPGRDGDLVAYQVPVSQVIRTASDGSFQITTSYGQLQFFAPTPSDVADTLQVPFPLDQPETVTFPPPQPDADIEILTDNPVVLAERIRYGSTVSARRMCPPRFRYLS